MASKSKMQTKNKSVFTIITDRLCQDSSEQIYGNDLGAQNHFSLQGFEFPLNYELQEIHQNPQTTQLSTYVKHLEEQVKSITNKIEYEYHQARETVLLYVFLLCESIGQATNLLKPINRKKIDAEFGKMGIVRKYEPGLRSQVDQIGLNEEELVKDAGDLAIDQVKRKIQIQWESEISDQMEKERRRLRELEKKKLKDLEQIDKDFQKLMKKRKVQRQAQQQLYKSQQSMKSLQNGESESNRVLKKIQKREKIQSRASYLKKIQASQNGSRQKNSIQGSQVESCSVMNNPIEGEENFENGNEESAQNGVSKINLLEASNSNQEWNHDQIIQKPNGGMESNEENEE